MTPNDREADVATDEPYTRETLFPILVLSEIVPPNTLRVPWMDEGALLRQQSFTLDPDAPSPDMAR
jgi:hypothetical protein